MMWQNINSVYKHTLIVAMIAYQLYKIFARLQINLISALRLKIKAIYFKFDLKFIVSDKVESVFIKNYFE